MNKKTPNLLRSLSVILCAAVLAGSFPSDMQTVSGRCFVQCHCHINPFFQVLLLIVKSAENVRIGNLSVRLQYLQGVPL
mgnify:CR=1 FL=1